MLQQQITFGSRRSSSGFTLLEALVAVLVIAFGMLAIAGFQANLSLNSDIAKQRSEATRLAQRRLDFMRTFERKLAASTPAGMNDTAGRTYTDNVVSSIESATTNATFDVTTTVTQGAGDTYRWVTVAVTWADRASQPQRVVLQSAISDGAPVDIGPMGVRRTSTGTLRPKNRNINVPYPAVTLAGGDRSAFVPPPGNIAFVFDNMSGDVKQRCVPPQPVPIQSLELVGTTVTVLASGHGFAAGDPVIIAGTGVATYSGTFTVVTAVAGASFTYSMNSPLPTVLTSLGGTATRQVTSLTEGVDIASTGLVCSDVDGYLLSGFVRFKTTGASPTAANISNSNSLTDPTLPLIGTDLTTTPITTPIRLDSTSTGNAPSSYECYAQRQLTVRRNSDGQERNIPEGSAVPTGFSDSNAPRFIAYTCVIVPVDHDSNGSTRKIWSAEALLVPDASWSLGTSSSTYRVCRFSSDYNRNSTLSNHEHPRYYRHISASVDNQNFLVIKGNDGCPTDVASTPLTGDFVDANTVGHQPAAVTELSFKCLTAACNGANKLIYEPSTPGTTIPME
jgi:Tfp pilus assembly protein PilV